MYPEPFGQADPRDVPSRRYLRYGVKGLVSAVSGAVTAAASFAIIPLANLGSSWALPLVLLAEPTIWASYGGFLVFAVWRREFEEWVKRVSTR